MMKNQFGLIVFSFFFFFFLQHQLFFSFFYLEMIEIRKYDSDRINCKKYILRKTGFEVCLWKR